MAGNNDILDRLRGALPEGSVLGTADRYGTMEVRLAPSAWTAAARFLREDPSLRFDMLVDLVGVDYSQYPNHEGGRFGVIAHLKSLPLGHRVTLKVLLEENDAVLGTLCSLYRNANFLEREAFDQFGVRFAGHPNLKRLLNHREFVGHPLRKDYPIQRRQWLSAPDPLTDEMDKRLEEKGWKGAAS